MLQTNQESFLSELHRMIEIGRQSNKSVTVTMKKYDGRTTRNPRKPNDKPRRPTESKHEQQQQPAAESKCLIRAKMGSKKVSYAIGQEDNDGFEQKYIRVIKVGILEIKKNQPHA